MKLGGNVMRAVSKHRFRLGLTGSLTAACLLLSAGASQATTTTTTFNVTITLVNTCTINSTTTLNFGNSVGVLSANIDPAGVPISVTCTNGATYNVGLDAGTGAGATVATRKMTSGGSTVNYSLYRDNGYSNVWGNTVSTDTVSSTGTGAAQSFTVYGRVPSQTTPASGTYSDTITVTVTY